MKHLTIGCTAVLLSVPAWADDDLLSAHGYRVGSVLDQSRVIEHAGGDEPVLLVKAAGSSSKRVYVELGADAKTIVRVVVEEDTADRNACATRKAETEKSLKAAFPKLGYYALENADMYFDGDRIVSLSCVEHEGGASFRVDRWDSRLLPK
jgi:hypothetical protein